jgi:hypothetical protein
MPRVRRVKKNEEQTGPKTKASEHDVLITEEGRNYWARAGKIISQLRRRRGGHESCTCHFGAATPLYAVCFSLPPPSRGRLNRSNQRHLVPCLLIYLHICIAEQYAGISWVKRRGDWVYSPWGCPRVLI